jgi:hypothetical protein
MKKPSAPTKTVKFRKYKNIDVDSFKADILKSDLITCPEAGLEHSITQYNSVLSDLLDNHAPELEKKITLRPHSPWYSETLHMEKRNRRKLERKWRRTKTSEDKQTYKEKCEFLNELITKTKTDYYSEMVNNCTDQKQLFKLIDGMLHRRSESPLPKHSDSLELANRFVDFFYNKIGTIRKGLEEANLKISAVTPDAQCDMSITKLSSFEPLSLEDARKIIMTAATKSCALDPIPTWLLKECLEELLPIITSIINKSLEFGEVPINMKKALVIPLLKKILLDSEILKNYRPVSNLSFLSKLTEKAVSKQTHTHTTANGLEAKFQSAYKEGHSTESALVRVQNDFLVAADNHKVGLLVLLDLSAAFDTIDHKYMLQNLQLIHGIEGTALNWYRSYLSDRFQSVVIDGVQSRPKKLSCGVPQGSILGPEMYTKYTKPLNDLIREHGLNFHMYADDTQLYIFFEIPDTEEAVQKLENCIAQIRQWLQQHLLKLNDEKTEVVVIGSKNMLPKLPTINVHIGEKSISPSDSARNIGVIMDKYMNMKEHVMSTCKAAHFHLFKISRIRQYLTREACEKLIHAFVSSKLDYGNALLYGIPENLRRKLQRVQNTAARLVCRLPRSCHITPVLRDLNWLPVKSRIMFKILLIAYKALNGLAPEYISELLQLHIPSRNLRSSSQYLLVEPRSHLSTYGDRAFSKVAPKLWNSLPIHIRCARSVEEFKKNLKTHLFKQL